MIQSKSKIIGLTGGIASGKSTVSKILSQKGLTVIDADIIAREVAEIGRPAYNDIVDNFGETILNLDKSINRKRLGEIVFESADYRFLLNNIVHPRIMEEIKRRIDELSETRRVIFLDIPLLIEEKNNISSFGIEIDEIWLVYTTQNTQIERLMKRDDINYQDALKRIKAQMSIEDKIKVADVVIDNTKGFEYLLSRIDVLISTF